MDVIAAAVELVGVGYEMVGEALLPGGKLRGKATRESAFYVAQNVGDVVGRQKQV